MYLGGRWSICYYLLRCTQIVAIVGLAIFGGAQPLRPDNWGVSVGVGLRWLQTWGDIAIPLLTALMIGCAWSCYAIGPPWVWATVHSILDEFRGHAFRTETFSDPLHYHRVTLFKYVGVKFLLARESWRSRFWPWGKGRYPWSGWLVPITRSGHTTKISSTVFLAPDDADNAEGIAGQTWALNSSLPVKDLPDLQGNPTQEQIVDYGRRTFVSEDWLRTRLGNDKPLPQSLHGIPVEVKGKPWGVLVLDSRSADGVKMARAGRLVSVVGVILNNLLERVK